MLYLHALRVVRARQVRGRLRRPIARRRFPGGEPPREAAPIPGAVELWRSQAFEAPTPPAAPTRLGRFHRQYGEDVLAAARSGDLEETRRLVATWIEAHSPHVGDAWHPYPLSTRVGNWVAALSLLPELASPELSRSLWRQLRRLELNVEDDVLGNHVIRNARALVLGGVSFGAPELTRRGIDLLRRELPEQVLPDGGHYERSPAYHLVVLRDLLEVQAASPHSWLGDAIESMRRFAAALARPDGAPALFNDGTVDAPRLDLPRPPEGLAVFPDSGFVVVREGELWLAFRCGAPAPAFLPAHAHADALSFQLWWRGRPVVVDPGTYTYEPGPDRDWFRSTRAHSTVTVDGRDQFRLWGAFRSGPLPKVSLRYARDGAVEASVVLPRRVRHVRRIEWNDGEISVLDGLEGRGRHRAESTVLWAPDAAEVDFEVLGGGGVASKQASLSERFSERAPTSASVVSVEGQLPLELGLRIGLG
ncbi:MAG: alginate lyase family protein [Actinomycetota bacterium]